jgi:hypothetical protein
MKKFSSISFMAIFCMFSSIVFAQQLVCNPMGVCATPGTSAALVVCNSALGCSYANESVPRRPVILSEYMQNFDVNQGQVQNQNLNQGSLTYAGSITVYSSQYQPKNVNSRPADRILNSHGQFVQFTCNYNAGEKLKHWQGGGATCER